MIINTHDWKCFKSSFVSCLIPFSVRNAAQDKEMTSIYHIWASLEAVNSNWNKAKATLQSARTSFCCAQQSEELLAVIQLSSRFSRKHFGLQFHCSQTPSQFWRTSGDSQCLNSSHQSSKHVLCLIRQSWSELKNTIYGDTVLSVWGFTALRTESLMLRWREAEILHSHCGRNVKIRQSSISCDGGGCFYLRKWVRWLKAECFLGFFG